MWKLALAKLIGVSAGLRAFTAPAAVSWAACEDLLPLDGTPLSWLADRRVAVGFSVMAAAELAGDLWPRAPNRTIPPAFALRVLTGALAGAAVAGRGRLAAGAALGGLASAFGTVAGFNARIRVNARLGRNTPGALIEDAITAGLAFLAIAGAVRLDDREGQARLGV